MSNPYISFIIPTICSRSNIFDIINDVTKLSNFQYEIVISYYQKSDSDKIICNKLKSINNGMIKIKESKSSSIGANRNSGARYATGKFLCFIDDDITMDSSFFSYIDRFALDENSVYFPEIRNEIHLPYPLGDHVGGKSYVSACFIIGRKQFADIGYMNETLNIYREDSELFIRCKKNGMTLMFMDNAFVNHPVRFIKWKTFKTIFMKNEYEPLFNRITSGNYYGVLTRNLYSTLPDQYGFSIVFYFFLFFLTIVILGLILNLYILIFLILSYAIFSVSITSLFIHLNRKILRIKILKNLSIVSIYLLLMPILFVSRTIGSIKYKHFTI